VERIIDSKYTQVLQNSSVVGLGLVIKIYSYVASVNYNTSFCVDRSRQGTQM